jgi:type IV secretion system protein VirB5
MLGIKIKRSPKRPLQVSGSEAAPASDGLPKPSNPFTDGKRRYNQFYGNVVLQAHNWRTGFFIMLAITAMSVWWCGHIGSQSKFIPYIVEVDHLGNVAYAGPVEKATKNDPRLTKSYLNTFFTALRSVSADSVVDKDNIAKVYSMVGNGTAAQVHINDFYAANNPYMRGATYGVNVEMKNVLPPASGNTWQVEWVETARGHDGKVISVHAYRASAVVNFNPPTDERMAWLNPLGLYVTDINWAEVLQ